VVERRVLYGCPCSFYSTATYTGAIERDLGSYTAAGRAAEMLWSQATVFIVVTLSTDTAGNAEFNSKFPRGGTPLPIIRSLRPATITLAAKNLGDYPYFERRFQEPPIGTVV